MVSLEIVTLIKAKLIDLGFSKWSKWYVTNRAAREGAAFVVNVLPAVSKHVLKCIELGTWVSLESENINGFVLKTYKGHRFPKFIFVQLVGIFFGPLEERAFHLWQIRELCEYMGKLALPLKEEAVELSINDFVSTDDELDPSCDYIGSECYNTWVKTLRRIAASDFPELFTSMDFNTFLGRRGSSGTFTNWSEYGSNIAEAKLNLTETYDIRFKAFSGFFRYRKSSLSRTYRITRKRDRDGITRFSRKPRPVFLQGRVLPNHSEVLFVPKDYRGPRTIVREPYKNIGFQMSFFDTLTAYLENKTDGHIQFTSQEVFQELARKSSKTKEFATVDLSSASDRVAWRLIKDVFASTGFLHYIEKFRTNYAVLPNGNYLKLNKLAGMGSGFTFPVMALLIFLSCRASGVREKNIYVYGDDTIIPSSSYSAVVRSLELSLLKVNQSKSFVNSHFRESCGGDFYHGQNVVPTRLKLTSVNLTTKGSKICLSAKSLPNALIQCLAHANLLLDNGLLSSVTVLLRLLDQMVHSLWPQKQPTLPITTERNTPFLSISTPNPQTLLKMYVSVCSTHSQPTSLKLAGSNEDSGNYITTFSGKHTPNGLGKDACFRWHLESLTGDPFERLFCKNAVSDLHSMTIPNKVKVGISKKYATYFNV
jgi:hypothetical protein